MRMYLGKNILCFEPYNQKWNIEKMKYVCAIGCAYYEEIFYNNLLLFSFHMYRFKFNQKLIAVVTILYIILDLINIVDFLFVW